MRVVGLSEFLTLPEGTIFMEYHGALDFEELCMKAAPEPTQVANRDFVYTNIVNDVYSETCPWEKEVDMLERGEEVKLDTEKWGQRWGLYDEKARFAVYSKDEVLNLIEVLKSSLEE